VLTLKFCVLSKEENTYSNYCEVLAQCYATMGVIRGTLGPCSPKYIISMICFPFSNFTKRSY